MNITSSYHDLPRYVDNTDLKAAYQAFQLDGLELMEGGDDEQKIIHQDDVIGAHLRYFTHWVCLWLGDQQAVLKEYGDQETCQEVFGGTDRKAIIHAYNENLEFYRQYSPEYMVLHVADMTIQGTITREFPYSDPEVIDATTELVNEVFIDWENPIPLLFENLPWPGLTLRDPEMLRRLLAGVNYPNCGVMLDIGHLLETEPSIRSQDEGIDFIYQTLSQYDDLDFIKGVHLHQSLSGEYIESVLENPFTIAGDYHHRRLAIMEHILTVDSHQPFISDRIAGLVDYINPDYLVFELISSDRKQHEDYLTEQLKCFK